MEESELVRDINFIQLIIICEMVSSQAHLFMALPQRHQFMTEPPQSRDHSIQFHILIFIGKKKEQFGTVN